jgi:hypothetical protein
MNCYKHKEVWVHPSARWLSILSDLSSDSVPTRSPPAPLYHVAEHRDPDGRLTIRITPDGTSPARFTLRSDDLEPNPAASPSEWKVKSLDHPWIALITPQGGADSQELVGGLTPR